MGKVLYFFLCHAQSHTTMVNLFWLRPPTFSPDGTLDYTLCAIDHIDSHIIKIPLEAAQVIYTAQHVLRSGDEADDWLSEAPLNRSGHHGYAIVHRNNPISKWARQHIAHYLNVCYYGLALCQEYTYRFGRKHACHEHLEWLLHNPPPALVKCCGRLSNPPCAMPDVYKVEPESKSRPRHSGIWNLYVYQSYRRYYVGAKLQIRMAEWRKRGRPEWVPDLPDSTQPKDEPSAFIAADETDYAPNCINDK